MILYAFIFFVCVLVYLRHDTAVEERKYIWLNKRRRNLRTYRNFTHFLFPLEHVGNGMVARELNVTVEDDTLAEYGCNVYGILTCNDDDMNRKREKFISKHFFAFFSHLSRVLQMPLIFYVDIESDDIFRAYRVASR